jgi:small-conductance mechanosensitive channel
MANNSDLVQLLSALKLESIIFAAIFFTSGLILAKVLSKLCGRFLQQRLANHQLKLVKRLISYTIFIIFTVAALQQLNVKLSLFLGAAGIFTLAIGFAAQTSVSNIISGLFLITEKPFIIGDTIQLSDGTKGEVLSIDLLSIKLRTSTNLFIRVPNEGLIKSPIINVTRFAIRRMDINLLLSYEQDVENAKKLLFSLAESIPEILKEPLPSFSITSFNESALKTQFSAWAKKENFEQAQNSLQEAIKKALDTQAILHAFPVRDLRMTNVENLINIAASIKAEKNS